MQQAALTELVNVETDRHAGWRRKGLVCKVDMQPVAGKRMYIPEHFLDHGGGQRDWKHRVLKTITVKNVRKTRCHECADTVIIERPRRMLAAGAAPKVLPGQKNRRTGISWMI